LTVASRIKLLAGMDIGQKRLPQDGSFVWEGAGRKVPIRVSTLPTTAGEKLVLRILEGRRFHDLTELGMGGNIQRLLRRTLEQPGLVLVTGAAGAGKTTTLYTILQQLRLDQLNVVTLEEPVEYRLEGVYQVQINRLSGLDFAGGLRAVLRQDPNVIFVGEIRDPETARMALRAAMTGHLVLSTLHTADACQAPLRLMEMGVEPHLVAAGLNAVLAQKLVRNVCSACHGLSSSCSRCGGTGYDGRTGVFQLLVMDAALRELLLEAPSLTSLRERAQAGQWLVTSARFEQADPMVLKPIQRLEKGAIPS
jgi:type II secretory ATPase GspE/PulE/Tfp pilus assembly ATPase PilB-like protein